MQGSKQSSSSLCITRLEQPCEYLQLAAQAWRPGTFRRAPELTFMEQQEEASGGAAMEE